jgi:CHAT domain-containing protein
MAVQEGRQIKELYPDAGLFSGNEATCGALSRELAQSDGFVHIAAHASRASENPLFSRILMSDGPFFPFDLFASGVKAALVTLSGCQTAAPGVDYGNSFSLLRLSTRVALGMYWRRSGRYQTSSAQPLWWSSIERSKKGKISPARMERP